MFFGTKITPKSIVTAPANLNNVTLLLVLKTTYAPSFDSQFDR